eukprot:g7904.t1
MTASSVGVRLSDDFAELPLFETPPLNGPTRQIGTAARGASMRAVEKQGDFLLLEADVECGGDAGGGRGRLGWVDASCVVPTSFPALYEFASDLPDAVSLVVRANPKAGAAEVGKVFGKGSIVMATGMEGDYISMAHQDQRDVAIDPSSPPPPLLQGWMLTATDDRVLLSLRPPFLVVPAAGLPEGVQLRVRSAPEGNADEVKQVSAAPGTIFEVAEQAGDWLRVLMGDAPSAWMSASAQGMPLLAPARRHEFVMDPALVAQHGDAVKLAVRAAPSPDGTPLGEITSRGRVQCVGTRGPWLRVLYQGHREAWMLSQTATMQLLVPTASVPNATAPAAATAPGATAAPKRKAPAAKAKAKGEAPSKRDGSRYMVCARRVTVRESPEFYAQDVGVVPEGGVVRVFEEKEEINEVKQTKDVWVRGLSANKAAGSPAAGFVEGWLLAFSTKRGAMMADAPDALAAQHAFEKQEEAAAAAAKPVVSSDPSAEELASSAANAEAIAAAAAAAPAASASEPAAAIGGYMRAAGQLKLREEADSFSLEVGTVARGQLVKVEEISGLWVRVLYRGNSGGWVLTANKRGPILSPAEESPSAAAQEFQSQESASAAAAAAEAAAGGGGGDEDRPLTGAKVGSAAASVASGGAGAAGVAEGLNGGGGGSDGSSVTVAAAAAGGSGKANAASAGQFLTSAGPLKIREEADPFSLDIGVIKKGGIVKVLETCDMWVRVSYEGRENGWVLTANKRGPILLPAVGGGSAAASQAFDAQEAAFAAAETSAADEATAAQDDGDRPLTGVKPKPEPPASNNAGGNDDQPLNVGGGGGGGNGAWVPPSEFPPGHEAGAGAGAGGGAGSAPPASAAAGGGASAGGAEFMTSLGPLKIREEADALSMDLGATEKCSIVRVLERSDLWARVCYRGREDGWVLTANKRGPTLVPCEDQAAAAGEFDAQEAAFVAAAAATGRALPEDAADRPLTGAKPPPAAAPASGGAAGADEDRPLGGGGGGKGSWVPPSEFPPGHEEGLASSGADGGCGGDGDGRAIDAKRQGAVADAGSESSTVDAPGSAQYMMSLGFIKVREEADPFSMDLGSVKKGDMVKVLEASELWVRVSYRGREDGWVLTSNKRGPTLVPSEDQAAAAGAFDAQEAAFAAAAESTGGALLEDAADRPLTGAKPPPPAAAPTPEGSAGDAGEDRPLSGGGGGKGSWVPPSEFPPGHEEEVAAPAGHSDSKAAVAEESKQEDAGGGGSSLHNATEGVAGSTEYMKALGFIKVREEADPFAMDLGSVKKGDVVKVLETSELWVRVSYRGREDGWVLTSNKRGPTLVPSEDQAAAAGEFDAQEAAFAAAAESTGGALPEDAADRPLTGAKPPPPAAAPAPEASAGADEDRPLGGGGGGKGSWVPPSEFLPREEGLASSSAGGDGGSAGGGDGNAIGSKESAKEVVARGGSPADGSATDGVAGSAEYMAALGFIKVREEADPFSMDLGSIKKGDLVKVLETLELWVRVSYRGREDGWVLTSNKRGPTLVPSEDQAAAAGEFDAQEAAFAAAAAASGGALPEDAADRPLTGAKPPPPAAAPAPEAAADAGEDRPLGGGGGGKGSWVPPSEFPPDHEEGISASAADDGDGGSGGSGDGGRKAIGAKEWADSSTAEGVTGSKEYMTALGLIKVREEADPFSMDLGSVKKGDVVKILETSELWVRVSYRGREDGWVLTSNKRGPTLVPSEDQAAAAGEFDAQEAAFAAAAESTGGALPEDAADRPLTGAKPPPPAAAPAPEGSAGDAGEDRPLSGGGGGDAWGGE